MASCLYCAVNRRRVLVGFVIDGQSGGHGVTSIDLSGKPGETHISTQSFYPPRHLTKGKGGVLNVTCDQKLR